MLPFIAALFVILIMIFIRLLQCAIPKLVKGGDVLDTYLTPAESDSLKCTERAFEKTFERAKRGYKWEAKVRHMFNCFVNKGQFATVDPPSKGKKPILPWLKRGKRYLSLDGYNDDLKIAFEYQGPRHYKKKYWKGNKKGFANYKANDDAKREACKKAGVPLIIIHYKIPDDQVATYIKTRLRELNALKSEHDMLLKIDCIPEPKRES